MGKRQRRPAPPAPPAPLNWRVQLETTAVRQYGALEPAARDRVWAVIDDLALDPRPPGARRLVGANGLRCRTGDWRVLYTVDDATRIVRVYRIGHRKDVYRNL